MAVNQNKEAWNKFLIRIKNARDLAKKSSNPIMASCSGSCSGGCGRVIGCDDDDCDDCDGCDDCSCEKEKVKKPNSETLRDDGCFCRNPRCNTFMPMAEPDDVGDGKALCYNCKNPWQ